MDFERIFYSARAKAEEWGIALTKAQLIIVLVLCSLLAGGALLLNARNRPAKVMVTEAAPKKPEATTGASGSTSAGYSKSNRPAEKVVVHVGGAVARPGVYEMPKGARVNDAVALAGGAQAEADLDAVNLASRLSDGQRIYIPKKGQPAPAVVGDEFGAGQADSPLDLNSATVEELDKLPGVGKVLAKRIVDYRASHGGFRSVEELQRVDGIGSRKFQELKDKVRVD